MKLTLHENSLFAMLLRSPWWVSALLALGIFGALRYFLPWEFALFAAAPFIGIGGYGAWKQLRRPSTGRIASTLEKARAMPREEFAAALEAGYKREGYGVTRNGDELRLTREGRVTLLTYQRWKAARTGVDPLREFETSSRGRDAHERAYVAVGEVTDTAQAFAAEKKIRLVQDEELARLLR
jgi:restriction system protein